MTNAQLPVFETDRLILRAVTIADVPSYQKHFNDYEVISHLSAAVPWPFPENGVHEFLSKSIFPYQGDTQWLWGIFEKTSPNELIGVVHLWRKDRPENRGFWLGRKFWGKGYMTEAVTPIMDHAFNKLGFEKLVFANAVGNIKSRRVKEKTGARLVEIKPAKFVNPSYTEHEIWELTKSEWVKHKEGNMSRQVINIESSIAAPVDKVWNYWTNPNHITQWNFAVPEWSCPRASNDLKPGGKYFARMEAKDGSFGFDFEAIYDEVINQKKLVYTMGDGRKVTTVFEGSGNTTKIKTAFDAETQNSIEMQKDGWQAILNNFKSYTEKN